MYEIWPGTAHVCDCLENSHSREVYRDITCEGMGDGYKDNPDCHDIGGQPPIVQNKINGIKVCGKRAEGLTLPSVQRPESPDGGSSYSCPEGTKACNESFLANPDLVDYAICIPDTASIDEACPITSFAFTLEDLE